ncbi:MAG: deoxyribonuclease IV [Epsilonproteobacteria bacterium]|nr:deoxyribonuclease IV [Campylobacterota bacterium]
MSTKKSAQALIGSHISAAGGLHKAVERGESIDCTAMQIFTKSNRTWFEKKISQEEADLFKQALKNSQIQMVCAHSAYLINLASSTDATVDKSRKSLLEEVRRCEMLDIPFLVLHPGSHTGAGLEAGIEKIAKNLDYVFEHTQGKTKILLETMAGQGTQVGYDFEHLKNIRSASNHSRQLGVCLDTCHIFAAGYDITSKDAYDQVMNDFDKIVGLSNLKIIHLNDSKTKLASHVDRHIDLGKGNIPLDAFSWIVNDSRLQKIPKILETPSDPDMKLWEEEIKLLRDMIK